MKAFSSAVSITLHAAVSAVLLFGTTKPIRSNPIRVDTTVFIIAPESYENRRVDVGGSFSPIAVAPPKIDFVPGSTAIVARALSQPLFSPALPTGGSVYSQPGSLSGLTEEHAEVLSAPPPVYPDLLRQAGVQGRVLLEATVDTTGRVLPASILVVSATNSGFVASARQALLGTLFRPAMVGGTPVVMRVRIPYEFAIRNGPGQAR